MFAVPHPATLLVDGLYICHQTQARENRFSLETAVSQPGLKSQSGTRWGCQHFHLDVELATFVHVPLAKGEYCSQALEWPERSLSQSSGHGSAAGVTRLSQDIWLDAIAFLSA